MARSVCTNIQATSSPTAMWRACPTCSMQQASKPPSSASTTLVLSPLTILPTVQMPNPVGLQRLAIRSSTCPPAVLVTIMSSHAMSRRWPHVQERSSELQNRTPPSSCMSAGGTCIGVCEFDSELGSFCERYGAGGRFGTIADWPSPHQYTAAEVAVPPFSPPRPGRVGKARVGA
eukprot:6542026-Prymnesium_polylepis.1